MFQTLRLVSDAGWPCKQISAADASREIGIDSKSYVKGRYLILLLDEEEILSRDEAQQVEAAVAEMNDSRTFRGPYESIKDIVERVFGNDKMRHGRSPQLAIPIRRATWDRCYGALTASFGYAASLDVPALTRDEVSEISAEIKAAIANLERLLLKVSRASP